MEQDTIEVKVGTGSFVRHDGCGNSTTQRPRHCQVWKQLETVATRQRQHAVLVDKVTVLVTASRHNSGGSGGPALARSGQI